jgi:alkylation response protein AidB-like acyl-CoA dehydrogenase
MDGDMNPSSARKDWDRWREDLRGNSFAGDTHLQSLLRVYRPGLDTAALRAFAGSCSTELDELIRLNNRDENLPRLKRWGDTGERLETVAFHPSYHQIGKRVYATGLMSLYREPGNQLETLAYTYLFAQNGEGGHGCPLACTAGLIKILQQAEQVPEQWLERLLDPDYDTHFHGSQFITEAQGGSDVGANAVQAAPAVDGSWRITGEKWFCSVIDAQLFLVTARPDGAPPGTHPLKAFAVPRHRADGSLNSFRIRRLKYKLGTRSMASAEVDFEGAEAHVVGDFRDVVSVVLNTSRIYNAIFSSAAIHRCWREARSYAEHRKAFGTSILGFPMVQRQVARLRTEAYASRSLTFYLAQLSDRETLSDRERGAWRMLVNLNKFWTSVTATACIRVAIEILGGNGAIEEFSILPRLLRDSIVCEAWEGSHNVLCAQTLRDSQRAGLHRDLFATLEELGGPTERLARCRERWERLVAMPPERASAHIRDLAEELRAPAQGALLRWEARQEGSDPLLPLITEHLLKTTDPTWDPLTDTGLADRLQRLVAG